MGKNDPIVRKPKENKQNEQKSFFRIFCFYIHVQLSLIFESTKR
jgi:hypothetical protein